jgi:arabinose-5-phosphate isomerase
MAICLLQLKGFSSTDFAKYHPGGALGKQLYLTVQDVNQKQEKPTVQTTSSIKEVIIEITSKRLGATAVLENGVLKGIITDGDIRRMLEKHSDLTALKASDIMNTHPKTIHSEELAVAGLQQMRANNISQLVVLTNNKYAGILHIHDVLNEGLL